MLLEFFSGDNLEILIRLGVATILGVLIGLEREFINKSAGLRTQTLVCIGAALYTVMSIYAFEPRMNPDGSYVPADPARVAAQIVTGVGFIGGGVVLKSGSSIYGITTAASLWISAAIGMACGCGNYYIATLGTFVSLLILLNLGFVERKYLRKYQKSPGRLKLNIHVARENLSGIMDYLNTTFPKIVELSVSPQKKKEDMVVVTVMLDIYSRNPTASVYDGLKNLDGYTYISVKQVE